MGKKRGIEGELGQIILSDSPLGYDWQDKNSLLLLRITLSYIFPPSTIISLTTAVYDVRLANPLCGMAYSPVAYNSR